MICQFCKQDVDDPCHDPQDVQQRAAHHIERCEKALQHLQGTASEAIPNANEGIVFG
jgi:hypothetical protein